VATLTKARGKKSDLSKRINVPLSRVSEWLHGKGEPTGDSVLRLQNWVAAEEEKQQKSPGDVTSATKGNARKRNPENEHQKAGPRGR
jgi:transcriptional regulator with XRE-family HTH domain